MVKKHNPSPSLAKERAERIKCARRAVRLSRSKFAQKYAAYGITESALQNWEDIRWYGLTENGASLLTKAFQAEGLKVTEEWLMYGVGENPLSDVLPFGGAAKIIHASEKDIIANELSLFHQHHANAVDTFIVDDGLAPWLVPGDCVAGVRYFGKDMEKAVGYPSIVQPLSGSLLVRIVHGGTDHSEHYTLTCSNSRTTVTPLILEEVKLFSVAPILWIRKSEIKSS